MNVERAGRVSVVGFGLVMTANAVLGLYRGSGWPTGVALVGGVLVLGVGVFQLHTEPAVDRPRLTPYAEIVAFLLVTVGFALTLLDFLGV